LSQNLPNRWTVQIFLIYYGSTSRWSDISAKKSSRSDAR